MGGSLKLWLVPTTAITSLASGSLVLSSTSGVYDIYVTQHKLNVEPNVKRERAGISYPIRINAFHPRIRQEATDFFNEINQRKYVVVFLDSNMEYNVAGTTDFPLRFKYLQVTGNDTPDLNGYDITLEGTAKTPPMIVVNPFD